MPDEINQPVIMPQQPEDSRDRQRRRLIFVLQLASFSFIWLFVVGIAAWIFNLLRLSVELDDAVGASAGISLVAIPVFFTLAYILTYVFVGLQKEERRLRKDRTGRGGSTMPGVILIVATGCLAAIPARSQVVRLPSDILEGRMIFEEKGCITCHALGGYGGTSGPDLSADRYFGSFMELASDVWNHIPQMYRKLRKLRREPPSLTREETLSLFAFLYSLRYLGEPGSVVRGRRLLDSRGCIRCHAVSSVGGDIGPDLASLGQYASPVFMSQTMWNHIPDMVDESAGSGVRYPELTGQDIVDISEFLRAGFHEGTVLRMSPGDPNKGKEIFLDKGCNHCHSTRGDVDKLGPDLSSSAARKSVAEIAALMWNHGPSMVEFMSDEEIAWPRFEGTDMADLIAYIYFLGFEDAPGDPGAGETVLKDKGCLACHGDEDEAVAPDFGSIGTLDDPIEMVQLMWNHAPQMEDRLLIRNKAWPTLSREEMQDIYAFLRDLTAGEAK